VQPSILKDDSSASLMQNRKQQFVRNAIWDAGIDLFAEKGFDESTVEDIAQAAGVSRRSFFRYFSSKNDLMGQAIVTFGTAVSDAIAACPGTFSQLEVLRHTVFRIATDAAANPRTRRIIEVAKRSAAARQAQISRMAEAEDAITLAYAARLTGASAGSLTPRLLSGLTLSIIDVTIRVWFDGDQQDVAISAQQVFDALTQIVCDDSARHRRALPS
jgi:AcrR family transcriptional regulator